MNIIDFNYVDIDETPITLEENPETILLQKEKLSSLSVKAKEVLELILNTPYELINLYTPYKDKTMKNRKEMPIGRLRVYFMKKLNWKYRKVLSTLSELKTYCQD